jgi:hypothetical protein
MQQDTTITVILYISAELSRRLQRDEIQQDTEKAKNATSGCCRIRDDAVNSKLKQDSSRYVVYSRRTQQ